MDNLRNLQICHNTYLYKIGNKNILQMFAPPSYPSSTPFFGVKLTKKSSGFQLAGVLWSILIWKREILVCFFNLKLITHVKIYSCHWKVSLFLSVCDITVYLDIGLQMHLYNYTIHYSWIQQNWRSIHRSGDQKGPLDFQVRLVLHTP